MLSKSDLDRGAIKWHLLVREGVDAGTRVELALGRDVRIGSAELNQLRLKDPSVSAHHVTLRLEDDGVHVADLHAIPRTSVGVVRVSDAVVPGGTLLRIGDTVLEVQSEAGAALAPSDPPAPRPYGDARRDAILAFEARYLADLVRLAGGNASHAARIAQMDRPHLLRLLRKHQLRSPSQASTLPPHSQVVVRADAPTDAAELTTPAARAMAAGAVPQAGGLAAPRLPRIDYGAGD
jgi:hypothetical protein